MGTALGTALGAAAARGGAARVVRGRPVATTAALSIGLTVGSGAPAGGAVALVLSGAGGSGTAPGDALLSRPSRHEAKAATARSSETPAKARAPEAREGPRVG